MVSHGAASLLSSGCAEGTSSNGEESSALRCLMPVLLCHSWYLISTGYENPQDYGLTLAVRQAGVKNAKQGAKPGFYAQTPDGTTFTAGSFADLHLSRPLLRACTALGYTGPTPIQAGSFPSTPPPPH